MSDPYAPPGSRRDPEHRDGRRRAASELPPSAPQRGRRPPDAEASLRTARLGTRFSLLVLAGLVASLYLPLPWSAGGVVFLVVGAVVGVMAVVSGVRARQRPASVVVMSVGLAMTALLVLVQAVQLAFWPVSMEHQRCRDSAVTATALDACEAQYQQRLTDLVPQVP